MSPMQQKERKGAWVLFLAILMFGTAVLGYGYYKRKTAEKVVAELSPVTSVDMDNRDSLVYESVEMSEHSKNVGRAGRKKSYVRKKREDIKYNVRDILADSIPVR